MGSRKKNRKNSTKKRSFKRRNSKKQLKIKKVKGGCGCGSNSSDFKPFEQVGLIKGGGDYFLPGYKEPPSFNEVPIRSFYSNNTYENGTDVHGAQVSSRLLQNMSGGKRTKKLKVRFSKKMKGGIPMTITNLVLDPIMNGKTDIITNHGSTSGGLLGYNIMGGIIESKYNSSPVELQKSMTLV
jgi:hypothetical protein